MLVTCSLFAQKAMTRADKMNILYLGLSNPISLFGTVPVEDLTIEMEDAQITADGNGKYTIVPETTGRLVLIIKYKGKEIGKDFYSVKPLPYVRASFGSIRDEGVMGIGEFMAQSGIIARVEGFEVDYHLLVKEFRLRIIRNGVKIFDQKVVDEPRFKAETRKVIDSIKVGDEVLFSDIKFRMPDKKSTELHATLNPYIKITIK